METVYEIESMSIIAERIADDLKSELPQYPMFRFKDNADGDIEFKSPIGLGCGTQKIFDRYLLSALNSNKDVLLTLVKDAIKRDIEMLKEKAQAELTAKMEEIKGL